MAGPDFASKSVVDIGRIFREEFGRSLAALIRVFGDIDVAQDAVQEAFEVALARWPAEGLPPNPGGWITTTARIRAIDRLRRESRGRDLLKEAAMLSPEDDEELAGRLRPALAVVYLIYNAGWAPGGTRWVAVRCGAIARRRVIDEERDLDVIVATAEQLGGRLAGRGHAAVDDRPDPHRQLHHGPNVSASIGGFRRSTSSTSSECARRRSRLPSC